MNQIKKYISGCIAILLCISMLFTSTIVYAAEVPTDAGDMTRDVVYETKDALFSAMRKAMLSRQSVDTTFSMTDVVRDEIAYFDTVYNQYFIKTSELVIFDFYGDQMGIPANEGDYLQQSYYGFSSMGNIIGNTIDLRVSNYMTTADQEAAFENKLASLFAAGGPLAHVKSLGPAEKVIACMEYIQANVRGETSYNPVRHTAYSALCEGTATCQGVALLFYRMLREVGLANRILMGVDAGAHTYNIVLIDGKYYYCDASANVVLKGSSTFTPAQLQEQYQVEEFRNNILSRISSTDYPLPTPPVETPPAETPPADSNTGNTDTGSTNTPPADTNTGNTDTGSTNTSPADTNNGNTNTGNTNSNAENSNTGSPNNNDNKNNLDSDKNNNTQDENNSEATTEETPVEYEILDGADSTYNVDSSSEEGLSLRAAGEIDKFVSVEVDGKEVDEKYYTVTEGSTIITFTKEFLNTLTEGEHVVIFQFADGFANAKINVVESVELPVDTEEILEDDTEDAQITTGIPSETDGKDSGVGTWIWIVLIVILLVGIAGTVFYLKKKKDGVEENEENSKRE